MGFLWRHPVLSALAIMGGVLWLSVGRGCGWFAPAYCWNQKLVVEVETPQGTRRGESVSRVCYIYRNYIKASGYSGELEKGEAAVVDPGGGQYLFVTIRGWENLTPVRCGKQLKALGAKVVHPYAYMNPEATWQKLVKKLKGQRCPIAPEDLPLLVTFTDIHDPKTVKRVDPRDLSAAFGPGYRLKAAWLEITDEPVTTGRVEKVLPCLKSGKACIPLNETLPYGHPMRNILNSHFWRSN